MRVLSLCSGIGGLDLGVRMAVPAARTVGYVEGEAFAVAVLAAQMEAGALDPAPVFPDLCAFDARPWVGAVDCVIAGFPCQPHSVAGTRRGEGDERWLWPDILRIIRDSGAALVFLENVPGLRTSGFGEVLQGLADLGFDAEWGCLRASDVGAPHERNRLWVLCSHSERLRQRNKQQRVPEGQPQGVCDQGAAEPGDDGATRRAAGASGWPSRPDIRRAHDGAPARVDRLRALGNGVVPQQAAEAWRLLAERMIGVAS